MSLRIGITLQSMECKSSTLPMCPLSHNQLSLVGATRRLHLR